MTKPMTTCMTTCMGIQDRFHLKANVAPNSYRIQGGRTGPPDTGLICQKRKATHCLL